MNASLNTIVAEPALNLASGVINNSAGRAGEMAELIESLKAQIRGLRALGYDNPLTATPEERLSLTSRIEALARAYERQQAERPPQTERRRKVVHEWEKFHGLTVKELEAAQTVIDGLQSNRAMTRIGWEEMLGSNEWKCQIWTSLTTRQVSHVKIVIGEAIVE